MKDGGNGVQFPVNRSLQCRVGIDGGSTEKPCSHRVFVQEAVKLRDGSSGIADEVGIDDFNTVKVGSPNVLRRRSAAGCSHSG